ncbi:CYTH and CHAD domain-containing protein [Streptomyces griseocarneus]|uniref:CYTH and CHAD domain-containing protein n=1 Tax=Streptomyces griseocarneus TaxID=51201 RepID=UPI00167EA6A3|nr:CYTH and CHAD domain-containing protein [Streptomyces griseocarneus]MBZ6475644.1 CYTH and CHAD domain-containing protein [Streptomyces griseocarneus]GHG69077.1 CHAD domain-containing protein [Streptomyces griseocarneus]
MADTVRENERKYEATAGVGGTDLLPDLSAAAPVATVTDRSTAELDAVYYDTADHRLAAAGITLRRRTGGGDAGWHVKLPVAPGVRDEFHAPLSTNVPRTLAALVRSRTRGVPLAPLIRIETRRDVRHLLDEHGTLLAEASTDDVRATLLTGTGGTASWTEVEVELAPDGDPALLDTLEPHLRAAGLRPSKAPSKLARALAETGQAVPAPEAAPPSRKADAGDHVLAFLREQAEAVAALDPGARRGTEDAVHQMRVATRRLRSAFRTYRKVLDRRVTDPIGEELKWLASELGVDRDREVLAERLNERLDEVPHDLVRGPVRARLRTWSTDGRTGSRRHLTAVLDSKRYLLLLETLTALLADPPLLPAAAHPARQVLAKAVLSDYARLAGRVDHALAILSASPETDTATGSERDTALHDARKAAKRARYGAEAATPALGKAAKRFAKRMKAVQTLLGDHQDSVMARTALCAIAADAEAAGESAFTFGVLYGREEQCAERDEREFPALWAKASDPRWRKGLGT